jgi:hypothetical protein
VLVTAGSDDLFDQFEIIGLRHDQSSTVVIRMFQVRG